MNSSGDHQPSTRDMTTLAIELGKPTCRTTDVPPEQEQTFGKLLFAVTLSELKQMVVILEAKPRIASMQSMKSCR